MDRPSAWIDQLAVSLSGLCLVHCLLGTVLLAILSAASSFAFSHEIHSVGLLLAAPLAAVGLWRGVKVHGYWQVAMLGALGLLLMICGVFATHGHAAEVSLTVLGVTLLAAAHLYNIRTLR